MNNRNTISVLAMTLMIGMLVTVMTGCGGGGDEGSSSSSSGESPPLTSLGYTLTGKVMLPDGSSGPGILVMASKVDEGGVTGKQAKVLAARPTGAMEFKKAV